LAIIEKDTVAPDPSGATKPKLPGALYVAQQAYRDWFGKDVQETPTVSYVWTADQFGHFGLGFQITYLLGWIAQILDYKSPRTLFGLAVANVTVWVVKEGFDYLRELKKARAAKSIFKFNGKEIGRNVFTALFYIAYGALVAGLAEINPIYGIYSVFAVAPFALWLAFVWLRVKITFQQAGLPYLYRLATFPNNIDRKIAEFIVEISKPGQAGPAVPNGKHFLISGPLDSGKSSLAVGIGTEFAFRLGIGRYTTLIKFLESAIADERQPGQPEFNDGRILWPWETSDLLIIDDVDVVNELIPGSGEQMVIERQVARQRIAALQARVRPDLLKTLKNRRTVWVVGDAHDRELVEWQTMIANVLGIEPAEIKTLDLTMKIQQALLARAAPTPAEQVEQ
jgi:hypothetical protein